MKLNYPKEWFLKSAEIEGDAEIGAGVAPWATEPESSGEARDIAPRIAFSHFVALWRRTQGWTPDQLASEAGIDLEEILEIESDPHSEPEPDAVFKLAGVFKIAPKALMELSGLRTSQTPKLREKAVRFAASSESIAELDPHEREAFEAFVAALGDYSKE